MRVALAVIFAGMIAMPMRVSTAQAPVGPAAMAPMAAQPAAPVVAVSTELQPALNSVLQTVNAARVDKWKRGNIRDEAAQNISQIQRDIDVTLPPMLRDADTAPASLSKLLPISRNISALYDVLLRVVEASRVSGPDDQVVRLQQALVTLGNARLAFGDRMQTLAGAMEKQASDLRTTVQTQAAKIAATPIPVAVPCTPPPTTRKTTTRKSAAKPRAAKPAPASSETQTKPGSTTQTTH